MTVEAPARGTETAVTVIPGPDRPPVVDAVLDLDKYQGFYGRLIVAGEAPEDEIPRILNPNSENPITNEDLAIVDRTPLAEVNFNRVAEQLSLQERRGWKGNDFDEALGKWVTRKVESINATTNEKRIFVLEKVYRKPIGEIGEEEVRDLFKRGGGENGSNINGFIDDLEDTFSTDGVVDTQGIKDHIKEIEAVAGGIFGKKTGKIVAMAAILKAGIRNNPEYVRQMVVHANGRLNKLEPEEEELLKPLYESFTNGQVEPGHDPDVSPAKRPEQPLILDQEDRTHGSSKAYEPEVKPPTEPDPNAAPAKDPVQSDAENYAYSNGVLFTDEAFDEIDRKTKHEGLEISDDEYKRPEDEEPESDLKIILAGIDEDDIAEAGERELFVSKKDLLLQEAVSVTIPPDSDTPKGDINEVLSLTDKPVTLRLAPQLLMNDIIASSLTLRRGEPEIDIDPENRQFSIHTEANVSGVRGDYKPVTITYRDNKGTGINGTLDTSNFKVDNLILKLKKRFKKDYLIGDNKQRSIDSIHIDKNGMIAVTVI